MNMQPAQSDIIHLSIDEAGDVVGTSSTGVLTGPVPVRVDGEPWATVPSHPISGSAGASFRCALPNVRPGSDGACEVSVVDIFGDPLAVLVVPPRTGRVNIRGFPAADVVALCNRPFHAVPYLSYDGSLLTVVGSHLPPGSDPSALTVEFGPGVAHELTYPLESPGWGLHFWYWPNALLSDFRLVIDLAASAPGSDPFTFRFRYRDGPLADLPEPYGRVWIPRDLGLAVGFPSDPTQLTRVQTWSDASTAMFLGFAHYCAIQAFFALHGVTRDDRPVLLDWGCGHGRVTRHFIREWSGSTVIGMDIDAENVEWALDNLRPGHFVASPLMPPCPLDDASVDAAFSISVMTHLRLDVQLAWLADLARVIRPGGIVLMSFGGPAAVAWSSVWNAPAYFEGFVREGIQADQIDGALDGKIEDVAYYRNVAQTHEHVRRHWVEHFDILEIIPEGIGNLDFAVLRRKSRS